MSLPVSDQVRALLQNRVKIPQLIMEIDGWPIIGSVEIGKYAEYGDSIVYGQAGLVYGGIIPDDSALPYIDLSKSTNQITQQLLIDKGGFSSVTSFDVAIVDKDQVITSYITPNAVFDEVLGKKVKLYLSLDGAGHPQDSILFFNGIVAGVSSGAGYVRVNCASPEKLKNLELFPKVSTELSGNVLAGDTTINVDSTADFISPADSGTLRTYIIIGDEIIEYAGKTTTSFTGCVRGQFGTIAAAHSTNDNVESAYRLVGNLRDLSLKLMLSGINDNYLVNEQVLSINSYGVLNVQNAIFINKFNIDQTLGVVSDDIVTITGGVNAGTRNVSSLVNTDIGSYIIVDGADLITEGAVATISIKSKYAVLPKFCGLEMTPDQVDVAEFENKFTQFSANFFNYDFFIKEAANGNEFINEQILYPSGCYALPRKAKTSLGFTIPPLAQYETVKLDETNVQKASQLRIDRSISKNFYNAVIYKFDKDEITDKFKRGKIRQSADSTNRIKIANKPLALEADGVRSEANFTGKFDTQARRFLDRYQYGAESISVEVDYGTGFRIELGDSVILDGRNLNISDTKDANATRTFQPRLFEVQNKTLNLKGQPIKLDLVDTAFNLDGRYGVISPSSRVGTGSTTTTINLKKSFGTNLGTQSEGFKWANFNGQNVRIRSKDYSFDETRLLEGVNPENDDSIIVSPALPSAPLENYIVDIGLYPDSTDIEAQGMFKNLFVYWNNQVEVVSGISQTQFTVSAGDALDIKIGDLVKIHDDTYTNVSVETEVTDVTGVTITVADALGFTPSAGEKIELLGWPDGGKPYRWL